MTKPFAIFCLSSSLILIGCQPTVIPQQQVSADYSRFQLVSSAFLYALDTKTGQLCQTFNQTPDLHVPKGLIPEGGKPLDRVPLCIDLSQDEAATIRTLRGQ